MRTKSALIAAIASLGFVLAVPAFGRSGSETMTGWISDSICGAKGMSAAHKDCAIKCVKEKGAKWVFVDAKTKTVYAIKNQDRVSEDQDLGKEVKLKGKSEGKDVLDVESISPAT